MFFVCSLLFAALKLNYPFCPVTSTPVRNLKLRHLELVNIRRCVKDKLALLTVTTCDIACLTPPVHAHCWRQEPMKDGKAPHDGWAEDTNVWDNATERLREAKLHPSMFCVAGTGKLHRTCDFTTLIKFNECSCNILSLWNANNALALELISSQENKHDEISFRSPQVSRFQSSFPFTSSLCSSPLFHSHRDMSGVL